MANKNRYGDDAAETDPLYAPQMREREKPSWDVFEDPPIVKKSGSLEEYKLVEYSVVAAKVFVTILCFSLVLGSAVVSKSTLLFMTSQILPEQSKPYCNANLNKNREFAVTLPDVERVAWMWIIIFVFCIPELGTFLRSLRILFFKSWRKPTKLEFFILLLTEILPAIGSALLVFHVLPNLNAINGAMLTNAACFIPGVTAIFSRSPTSAKNGMKMILDIMSVVAQGSVVIWPLIFNDVKFCTIPVAMFLISVGWWQNFVSEESKIPIIRKIARANKQFDNNQYVSYFFISVLKCLAFFGTAVLIIQLTEGRVDHLFDHFLDTFKEHTIQIKEISPVIENQNSPDINDAIEGSNPSDIHTYFLTPFWVLLINVISTYVCYAFGKWACKIMIQGFGFAFPINMAMPVTLSALIAACGAFIDDSCAFNDVIPRYLFFNLPNVYDINDFISHQHSWIWLMWLLSQTWITVHIWMPHCERLEKTEKLFMRPMYDAFLIDQSIALNRRRDENFYKLDPGDVPLASLADPVEFSRDTIPRIYACATMWHETKEEMMEFLKSIMRLDEDQHARRLVRNYMGFVQQDYYELETHIFFDDAFVRTHQEDNDPHVNEYVLSLFEVIDAAATEVHGTTIRVRPPKICTTPYGGRLVWTLPGKTKMYVHLKDKKRIRNKKRWSQVMYMYYLLGHRLMDNSILTPERKAIISEYTFILALDGDIDFQPQAMLLLVNLMKKNKTLGAACGRIHPIGSGPMVWYQMFEYAIGHWLQKATEHMIGCVLCSPGCFSLFRAEALMDKNVMKKYTTTSELPMHYVQYDQGEDRWLCTLLLQRGYRVEYSAASDAYTHCPESFNEFYNQRRRWMPSTIANIMDLLMDYKRTVKINDNISTLYIIYQGILMIGTVLGPGTIFLMLVGAFVSAFQLDQWTSFFWNIVPVLLFFVVSALFNSNIQLMFAALLSAIYGLVMMAVLVGVMLQITEDGWLAPSSLFFFIVAGEMIITALMHPKEVQFLKYGVVYYVTVPSMYMLLVIYSVFNMNNVSWGTREVTVVPAAKPDQPQEQKPAAPAPKKNKILGLFGANDKEESGSLELSCAGLFKCLFCTHSRENDADMLQLKKIQESIDGLSKKLTMMERHSLPMTPELVEPRLSRKRTTVLDGLRASRVTAPLGVIDDLESGDESTISLSENVEENSWLYDGDLARGEVECLSAKEESFWEDLVGTYLKPIDESHKKDKIAKDLKDLRDKVVMAFFMVNALFVLTVFLLTLKKDVIHAKWPFGAQYNFTYHDDSGEFRLSKHQLELEPIGFVFLIFFAILLIVQFIAMLLHRFETFSQIMSTTKVNFKLFNTNPDKLSEDEILESDPVTVAKKLQKIKGVDEDDENKPEARAGRRQTAFHLAQAHGRPTQKVNDLETAFNRRMAKCIENKDYKGPIRRDTVVAVNRRYTIARQSQMRLSSPYVAGGGNDNPGFIDDSFPTNGVSNI